jgi:2-keto-4-pentenoate hydratase/2-oxohepta-3-ene-1,7-dioic acid hydratase in catechol pathway
MRLVTYETDWELRAGVQLGTLVVDAAAAATAAGLASEGDGRWVSTRRILAAGQAALATLGESAARLAQAGAAAPAVRELAELRLGPPVPDPDKIVCLGLNYRDHAEEAGLDLPSTPLLFAKYRNSLIGPADPIPLPANSAAVDYEAELAIVIGRRCKDVAAADALDCVAGAMALNDVSARDLQHATSQWMAGKAIDGFAPCGPALVLRDELGDPQDLPISTRVNGTTLQDANTSLMIFSVAETIAYVSSLMTLEVGDIIATGTPAGVGFARDPQVLLAPGDVVEVEIGGIGTLRNPVVAADGASGAVAAAHAEAAR